MTKVSKFVSFSKIWENYKTSPRVGITHSFLFFIYCLFFARFNDLFSLSCIKPGKIKKFPEISEIERGRDIFEFPAKFSNSRQKIAKSTEEPKVPL